VFRFWHNPARRATDRLISKTGPSV